MGHQKQQLTIYLDLHQQIKKMNIFSRFFYLIDSMMIIERYEEFEIWKNGKKITISKDRFYGIVVISPYFLILNPQSKNQPLIIYDIINNNYTEIENCRAVEAVGNLIVVYDTIEKIGKVMYLNPLEIIAEFPYRCGNKKLVAGKYLLSNIYLSDKEIICLDTERKDPVMWKRAFDEKYRAEIKISLIETKIIEPAIFEFIGVYNNLLWLVLKTGHILALDVETGKEVHSLLYPSNTNIQLAGQQVNYVFQTKYSRLDSKNGKIVGFYRFYYWEIDLNNDPNANFIVYSWESDSKEHNIVHQSSHGCYWEGDYIYFYQAERDKKIGIFSRSQRKLVWSGIVEELQSSIAKIAYYDGNILIHDNAQNLHFIPTEFIP